MKKTQRNHFQESRSFLIFLWVFYTRSILFPPSSRIALVYQLVYSHTIADLTWIVEKSGRVVKLKVRNVFIVQKQINSNTTGLHKNWTCILRYHLSDCISTHAWARFCL